MHVHLNTPKIHFRCAVVAYLEHNYNMPHFLGEKFFKQSVAAFDNLLFLWRFSKTLSKQAPRLVDYFVFKLITKWYQTNSPRCLKYKSYVVEFEEWSSAYSHFVKVIKKLIKTCFNNFKVLATKIHVLLFLKLS